MKTLNGVFGCLYACMYVCMYVCVYVCMYIYMYVCICMHVLFTVEGPMVDEPFDSMGYPLEIKTLYYIILYYIILYYIILYYIILYYIVAPSEWQNTTAP